MVFNGMFSKRWNLHMEVAELLISAKKLCKDAFIKQTLV